MAKQATGQSITGRSLSSIIRNPALRAIFRRAERDQGGAMLLSAAPAAGPRPRPPEAASALLEAV
jgi:hypothetical protein